MKILKNILIVLTLPIIVLSILIFNYGAPSFNDLKYTYILLIVVFIAFLMLFIEKEDGDLPRELVFTLLLTANILLLYFEYVPKIVHIDSYSLVKGKLSDEIIIKMVSKEENIVIESYEDKKLSYYSYIDELENKDCFFKVEYSNSIFIDNRYEINEDNLICSDLNIVPNKCKKKDN